MLYRLSISKYKEQFALKGAMLLRYWLHDPHRPTRDLDLLGFGESAPQLTRGFFKEICETQAADGVRFDTGSLEVDTVRDESGYAGLRLKCYATIDGARLRIVIDIGYGDAAEPGLNEIELLTLLDEPAPKLRAYPPETVIAEKFQAMVHLGLANTRKISTISGCWPEPMNSRTTGFHAQSKRPLRGVRPTSPKTGRMLSRRLSPTTRPRFSNGTRSFRTSLSILDRLPMLSPRLPLSWCRMQKRRGS